MRVLLDTHAFIWAVAGDPRLSAAAAARFLDPDTTLLLSVASVWEMAIKVSLGRLQLGEPLDLLLERELTGQGIGVLSISREHALAVRHLPLHHRDPFDRLLIAQARREELVLLTRDRFFHAYDVRLEW